MPTPQAVTRKDGSTRHKVRFRDGKTNASETFVTRKQAQKFCELIDAVGGARARQIINEHDAADVITHTLGEVVDLWFEWKSARRPNGSPLRVESAYTLTRYEQLLRLHIKPALGHLQVNLVTELDVQAFVDDLAGRRSAKVVADAHSVLHSVYAWANSKNRGLAIVDPCTETELPAQGKRTVKGFHPDEWRILHRAALDVDGDAADLLLFMVHTGWRFSEAVAPRRMDIDDLGDQQIEDGTTVPVVFASVGRVLRRVDGTHFEFVEDEAKSQAGIRRVRLGTDAALMVRRRIRDLEPHQLVFTTRTRKPWRYSSFHSDFWTYSTLSQDGPKTRRRILQRAHDLGLARAADAKLHWLRHTHAGLLLMAGEPMAAVQKRLGHEDIRTTVGVYGSMVSDVSVEGLSRFDALMGGEAPELAPGP